MFKLKRFLPLPISLLSLLLALALNPLAFAEDTLTITTYYPSPYGVYREMRSQRLAIGDNYIDNADYTWEESDGDGGEIDYLADLVVEGNVGIGTTNPETKLHIYNSTIAELVLEDTAGDHPKWGLTSGLKGITNAQFGVYDYTNSIYRLMISTSTGNVGIGTTSPAYQLDVLGPIRTKGKNINWNTGGIRIEKGDNTGYRWLYINSAGGQLRFYNGVNEPYIDDSGVWNNASDISLKKNIIDLRYGLNEIMKLQPRSYLMKSNNEAKIGFIAQEVEKIIPEVVSGEEGKKGMSYGNLVSLAIKGIQEQQRQIEKQQQQIKELKEELAGLKKEKI